METMSIQEKWTIDSPLIEIDESNKGLKAKKETEPPKETSEAAWA
jgi:hypothetical protein